jgi:ABC-type multidrug transport system fused ATPase/permease subunit
LPLSIFLLSLPQFIFLNTPYHDNYFGKSLCSLLSPSAFVLTINMILEAESRHQHIHWYGEYRMKFCVKDALLIMLLDVFIYGIFGYLFRTKIFANCHSRYLYFVTNIFSCYMNENSAEQHIIAEEILDDEEIADAHLVIRRVTKKYRDGTLALNQLSLQLIIGKIVCLLGHNGAGD